MEKEQTSRRNFLKTMAAVSAAIAIPSSLEALASSQTAEKRLIVLDPGHGMNNTGNNIHDPGAVYEGVKESKIVLDQAKRIRDYLQQKGYEVRLTREDEQTPTTLKSRPIFANNLDADIFISLHCNAFGNPEAKGVRTYHHKNSQKGKKLGSRIQDALIDSLSTNVPDFEQSYEGLRTGDYHVLNKTAMPAVLIESGFLSNPKDRSYLVKHPDVISKAIAEGIHEFLEEN